MAVTWASAIEDPISEWRWLLRLEGQGIVLRYSNADSVVDEYGRDYSYEGILRVDSRPAIAVLEHGPACLAANLDAALVLRAAQLALPCDGGFEVTGGALGVALERGAAGKRVS